MNNLTYSLLVQKLGKRETGYHGKEEEKVIDVEGDAGNFTLKSRKDFPTGRANCPEQNEQCGRPGGLGEQRTQLPSGDCLPHSCLAHASGQDSPFRCNSFGRKHSAA